MGCGGSSERNSQELNNSFIRKQKVSIRVGFEVKVLDQTPKVIFIFGGPGSRKGRIVEDLINMFGFQLINAEELLLKALTDKLEKKTDDLQMDLQELLKAQPDLVTLEYVLRLVMDAMDMDKDKHYCIDVMPNLKSFLKMDKLHNGSSAQIGTFESKYPVSFALNLAIPSDKLIKKVAAESVKHSKSSKPEQGAQSDEADSSRTQKRALMYDQNVKPFLDYFQESERLVTVDVSCGVTELIWNKVCEFFAEMEFPHLKIVNTVILFAFDQQELNTVDLLRFGMKNIVLKSSVEDPTAPVEKLLKSLCKVIDNSDPAVTAFAVGLFGTSITRDSVHKFGRKSIMFMNVEETCSLEKFIPTTGASPMKPVEYKAVMSSDNEVCLFPMKTNTELCRLISLCMAEARGAVE